MASNYPVSLDTTATLPAVGGVGANLSTFPHSTLHGNADDAIIAIETELGLAPSDTFSTVKARLDSIAAKLAAITPVPGQWSTWTPGISQNFVAVSATVNYARYQRIGRTVLGNFKVTITGTGTAGTAVLIGNIPATAADSDLMVGTAAMIDISTTTTAGNIGMSLGSTTHFDIRCAAVAADNRLGVAGTGFVNALAAGDIIRGQFVYEAAAD